MGASAVSATSQRSPTIAAPAASVRCAAERLTAATHAAGHLPPAPATSAVCEQRQGALLACSLPRQRRAARRSAPRKLSSIITARVSRRLRRGRRAARSVEARSRRLCERAILARWPQRPAAETRPLTRPCDVHATRRTRPHPPARRPRVTRPSSGGRRGGRPRWRHERIRCQQAVNSAGACAGRRRGRPHRRYLGDVKIPISAG